HDGSLAGFTRLEEFDDARQAARDVLRLRRLARNLRDDIARLYHVAVVNHEVRADGHLVGLQNLVRARTDFETRLALLVGRVLDDDARLARHLVNLLLDRHALLQVLILNRARDLRENREGERVPRREELIFLDALAV